jgi:hypothetical protein
MSSLPVVRKRNYISIKPTGCPELCTISTARLRNFVIFYVTAGSFGCIEMNNLKPSADFIIFPIAASRIREQGP